MQQRNNAADYKEYGTNYTKKEQSIIESYTPIIKIDIANPDSKQVQYMNNYLTHRIAISPGMSQPFFDVLFDYAESCFFYQTDHRFQKSSNNIHTLNNIVMRGDIKPQHPTKLPLGPSNQVFLDKRDKLYETILDFLICKVGMHPDVEKYLRIRLQCFPEGEGIGSHADGDNKIGDLLYAMRFVFGLGAPRTLKFTLHEFDLDEPSAKGKVISGVNYNMTTNNCASGYLMPPDISGKKPFCYTNQEKSKEARAQHELVKSAKGSDHAVIFVADFHLRSEDAVNAASFWVRNNVIG